MRALRHIRSTGGESGAMKHDRRAPRAPGAPVTDSNDLCYRATKSSLYQVDSLVHRYAPVWNAVWARLPGQRLTQGWAPHNAAVAAPHVGG